MKYLVNFRSKLFSLFLLCLFLSIVFLQNKDISLLFKEKTAFLAPLTLIDVQKIFPKAVSFELPLKASEWGKAFDETGQEI